MKLQVLQEIKNRRPPLPIYFKTDPSIRNKPDKKNLPQGQDQDLSRRIQYKGCYALSTNI